MFRWFYTPETRRTCQSDLAQVQSQSALHCTMPKSFSANRISISKLAKPIAVGLLICAIAHVALARSGPACAAENYGAIAASRGAAIFGWAYGGLSRSEAEKLAMHRCRQLAPDCRSLTRFRNLCAAIAVGENGGWGYATRDTTASAMEVARSECSKNSRTCSVRVWMCTFDCRWQWTGKSWWNPKEWVKPSPSVVVCPMRSDRARNHRSCQMVPVAKQTCRNATACVDRTVPRGGWDSLGDWEVREHTDRVCGQFRRCEGHLYFENGCTAR